MHVWIDADACPVPVRDIVLRASGRRSVAVVFVASKLVDVPVTELISFVQVPPGPDAADAYIAERAKPGDLAITQDIPLAAILVPKGVTVITPRGESYNADNIGDLSARRNLMQELRDQGAITGGPRPFDDKLKRQFANLFDAAIHRLSREVDTRES
jgi:uncharacterized protein YaiI (UPF0178 family)